MAEFTKEQLIEEVNYNLEHCFCSDKTKRLMEIALAALTETQLPQPAVLSVPDEIPKLKDGMGFKYVKDGVRYSLNYANGWNQCRAAMLQAEPVSNSDELPLDYLQGHKDGLEWAAQLAEANHPQTGDWLYDDPIDLAKAIRKGPDMPTVQGGNSPVTPALLPGGFTIEEAKELHEDLVRSHISKALSGEKMKKKDRDADLRWIHGVIVQAAWFVKASLAQNALSGNSPVTPDGWISCSERMPDTKTAVLVAREFDRKGDWRMKWATYIPGHPDANDGWIIPGASWIPSHWMPLPEPPQEAK